MEPSQSSALNKLLEDQKRRMERQRRAADLRRDCAQQRQLDDSAAPASAGWWEVDLPPNMVNVSGPADLAARLDAASAAGQLAVASFFSPSCYACRSLQPKLRRLAADAAGAAVFLKVDASRDGLREACEADGVTKIPYFQLWRGGAVVAEFTANMQPEKLRLLREQLAAHMPQRDEEGQQQQLQPQQRRHGSPFCRPISLRVRPRG